MHSNIEHDLDLIRLAANNGVAELNNKVEIKLEKKNKLEIEKKNELWWREETVTPKTMGIELKTWTKIYENSFWIETFCWFKIYQEGATRTDGKTPEIWRWRCALRQLVL